VVKDSGQLYTIEGVAAGVLMIVTAYLVVSTTTILTPQDVHIVDMQLQQLGNDALAMMDMPDQYLNETGSLMRSNLSVMVEENDGQGFEDEFLRYLNMTTGTGPSVGNYAFNATIYYRNSAGVQSHRFRETGAYYRENAVKVSRWVFLPQGANTTGVIPDLENDAPHSVLLEVLLWRV
jgi:hypothetical protein